MRRKLKSNYMKYLSLFLLASIISISVASQYSIPNGNFESWKTNTYDYPTNYPYTSNPNSFYYFNAPFNAVKSMDAFHGSFAIQLSTVPGTDTSLGYFLNTDPMSGDPQTWSGGIPYNQKPTGIRGYYKYNVASADSALIVVVFSKAGVNIGTYFMTIGGIKNTYTLFDLTFSPALTIIPDSVIIGATSSNFMASNGNGVAGSILKLDSFSFTGVTSQPANMNGDLESWQTQNIDEPLNWSLQGGMGVSKTTDASAGAFALNLRTYAGDNNNVPQARAGFISNGFYDQLCNCMKGGNPFTNKIDTLVFSYKYTPVNPNDSAFINLGFKQTGVYIYGLEKNLGASANYTTVSIPFNSSLTPDSVIFTAQSSLRDDTALSYVGANLKIDEIHFKSQPLHTGIKYSIRNADDIQIYPNPFRSSTTIYINDRISMEGMKIRIYDISGRLIYQKEVTNRKILVDGNLFDPGTLFYEIYNADGKVQIGKIILE